MSGLHRFARHLAAAADSAALGASRAPLGIGEVMERIMPYRTCRRVLGLDTVEDYEILLLRLVAEEEQLARAFPPEAAERARAELAGVAPEPSLARRLTDATILLDPAALARPAAPGRDQPSASVRIRDYQMAPLESEAEIPGAAGPGPTREPAMPAASPAWTGAPRVRGDPRGQPEEDRAGPVADPPGDPVPEPAPESQPEPEQVHEPDPEPETEPEPEPSTILADHLELEPEVWEADSPVEAPASSPGPVTGPLGEPEPGPDPEEDAEAELLPGPGIPPAPREEPVEADQDDQVHWAPAAGPLGRPISRDLAEALEAAGLRIDEPAEPDETAAINWEPVPTSRSSGAVSPPPLDPPPAAPAASPAPACPHCAATLPVGRTVRFCPACGRNLVPLRCVRCLSELEPEWRHCVSCGHPTADSSRFA